MCPAAQIRRCSASTALRHIHNIPPLLWNVPGVYLLLWTVIWDHHHCHRSETYWLLNYVLSGVFYLLPACLPAHHSTASRTASQALLWSHSHEFLCINHTRWLMWLSFLYFMMWVDMKYSDLSLRHWQKSWVSPAGEHSVCLPAQEDCLSLFIASFWWTNKLSFILFHLTV